MSQNRLVYVRNDNESITYVGDWTAVQASTVNDLVNLINGPVFSPTLHSTITTSSFIFPFNGSSINVIGSLNVANLSHSNQDPTWKCAVDGIDIGVPHISSFNQENIRTLCSQGGISDGVHELVVNVTSKGMPFYLDVFEYQPSSNVSLENSLVNIENTDPAVDFISGWGPIDIRNGTKDPEGLVNVTFIGTQLAWYGYTPFGEPHNASSGKYSIDGQPYMSFQLPGLSQSFSSTAFNRLFFTTPVLEMGTHVLSAKYTGSPGQTPFTFEYLIVTNGSFPSTGSPPSNSSEGTGGNPTSSPAPSTNDTSKPSSHVGSIVGGVVGAIGGIVICSIIAFFWLKSCKRRRTNSDNKAIRRTVIESFSPEPQFVFQAAPLSSKAAESSPSIDESHGSSANATYQPSQSSINQTSQSQRFTTTSYSTATLSNDLASAYTTDVTMDGSLGRPLPPPPPQRFIPPPPSRKGSAPVGGTDIEAPIQHEDSDIRLSHSVLHKTVVGIPPTYSDY